MLGCDELAIGWIAQRGNLHEAVGMRFDAGFCDSQWCLSMNDVEACSFRFAKDADRVHYCIDARQPRYPRRRIDIAHEVAGDRVHTTCDGASHTAHDAMSRVMQGCDEMRADETVCTQHEDGR